jgi:multiple sugar transport system substrate-binding protein
VSDNDVKLKAGPPGRSGPRNNHVRRRLAAAVALTTGAMLLAACGGDSGGAPTLTWYINPDSGGQVEIAKRCTEASGGKYQVNATVLPREAAAQREQLVRRLAANDDSIDIMSLDPPFIPEFAEAGFLAEVPQDVASRVTEGVVDSAVAGSTWKDKLVAIPFWANTQLLWYRKSVAEAAGLDMSQPVTWQQIIDAAKSQKKDLGVQGIRAEALTVWINALVESAGGHVLVDPTAAPDQVKLGLETEAGREAAGIIQEIADDGLGGPALSTQNEDSSATAFEGGSAAFMVNWPFVWPRANSAVEAGTLEASVPEDYGWALYPAVKEGEKSRPPYGGINLGVGAFSKHPDLAFAATECITSEENESYYFTTNGNPAARAAVYEDPKVIDMFPMAPVIRQSLEQAAPRPQTPYYNEVSSGLQRTWHPPSSVNPDSTPKKADSLITAVLRKEKLL